MKLTAAIFFTALLAFRVSASLVSSNLFTYQSISATNTTDAVLLGSVYLPQATFAVQNGGLSTTNSLAIDFQVGMATNSMATIFTYTPSTTNATIDSVTATNSGIVQIYVRAVIRPTNTLSCGVQMIQQK